MLRCQHPDCPNVFTPSSPQHVYCARRCKEDAKWLRKRELIDAKKVGACEDCGNRYPPFCMDLDHIDPSKKRFKLSDARKFSFQSVRDELVNTRLLCAICHRLRTFDVEKTLRELGIRLEC